jgi:hypothetical protein
MRRLADETKDQGEQDGEDNRCHDREVDTDISRRAFVFDVTWKKRLAEWSRPFRVLICHRRSDLDVAGKKGPPGGSVRYAGICASVTIGKPIDKSKCKHDDNEKLQKRVHDTRRSPHLGAGEFKANNGFCDLDLDQTRRRRADTKSGRTAALYRANTRARRFFPCDALMAFSIRPFAPAGRPHQDVLEKNALIAGWKQGVALRA